MPYITYFSLFIVIDSRCQASISGKVIWKCNHLLELLEKPDILLDENEYTPQKVSDDFVALGGWEFRISSIYPNATLDDMLNYLLNIRKVQNHNASSRTTL